MIKKVVGCGLGVDDGVIVFVGAGVFVRVFVIVGLTLVAEGEGSILGEMVAEGCVVDVLIMVLVGSGLRDIGNSISVRSLKKPPTRTAAGRSSDIKAIVHPVIRPGPKLRIIKEKIATVIAKSRWPRLRMSASGQIEFIPKGNPKPATATGKRIS